MRIRSSRAVSLLAAVGLAAASLGAVSGCTSQQEAGSNQQDTGDDTEKLAQRARQVAAAWDGSAADAAWRSGYHPMGEVIQLPRGGLRDQADKQAYQARSFALRGTLPATAPEDGSVIWDGDETLTRPLTSAQESYESMGDSRKSGEPSLTVTGAELGEMNVTTSRGPATVPAWLFTIDGYEAPLRHAAVSPSELAQPPVKRTHTVSGNPLDGLVRISTDGRVATVIALHGACDDGAAVAALETRDSVVLSASVKNPQKGGLCTKELKPQRVTVELDRPLGDRILLDAITGKPVPYKPARGPSPSWR